MPLMLERWFIGSSRKNSFQSARRSLALLLALANLVVAGFGLSLSLYNLRNQERTASQIVDNSVQNLVDGMAAFTGNVDMVLSQLSRNLPLIPGDGADEYDRAYQFLREMGHHSGFLPELYVFDAQGRPLLGSSAIPSRPTDLSSSQLFLKLHDSPTAGFVVSAPEATATPGEQLMLMGRRLPSVDGSFAGAVILAIPARTLNGILSPLDFGHGVDYAVIAPDLREVHHSLGSALFASDELDPELAPSLKLTVAEASQAGSSLGHARLRVTVNRKNYLLGVGKLPGQPLFVVSAYAESDFLAQWRTGSVAVAAIIVLFLLLSALLYRLHYIYMKRMEAEGSHLRTLVQTIPEPVWLKNPDGVFLVANPECLKILGRRDEQEVIGHTDYDFLPADEAEAFRARDRAVLESSRPSVTNEWITYAPDGRRVLLETIKTPMLNADGSLLGILGAARNITDHLRVTEVARLYAILSQADRCSVTAASPKELFTHICRVCVENGFQMVWVGLPEGDDTIHPVAWYGKGVDYLDGLIISVLPDTPASKGPSGQAFLTGKPVTSNNFLHDPRTVPWHSQAQRFGWGSTAAVPFTQDGKTLGIITLYSTRVDFFDEDKIRLLEDLAVTASRALQRFSLENQQQELNASLRASEARFSSVFHSSPVASILLDAGSGLVIDINTAFSRIFGQGKDDALGCALHQLNLFADSAETQRLGLIGPLTRRLDNQPIQCLHRQGGKRDMLLSVEFIDSSSGKLCLIMLSDVTALREAERALVQAEMERVHMMRLGMLGEVASTIAHEINQPIGAAANYLQTARLILGESPASTMLEKAETQIMRASTTIKRVRDFASNRESAPPTLESLQAILTEGCALGLLGQAGQDVSLRITLPEDLPKVLVDRIQIEQVVTNLVRNAAEAMRGQPDKVITITAKKLTEGRIEVSLDDTGPGIAESLKDQLFKPFMTTKADGTGLGLSISRAIIRACGGELWVESFPVTSFHFTLPTEEAPHG